MNRKLKRKCKNAILAAGTLIAILTVGIGFCGMISQGTVKHFITYLSLFWVSVEWLFLVFYANGGFKDGDLE